MRWMEQCAYIAASRIGRSGHLLTGSLDSLAFAQPTRVGDIMYVTAQVWNFALTLTCGRLVITFINVALDSDVTFLVKVSLHAAGLQKIVA